MRTMLCDILEISLALFVFGLCVGLFISPAYETATTIDLFIVTTGFAVVCVLILKWLVVVGGKR